MKSTYWILGLILNLVSCDNNNLPPTDNNFDVGRFVEQKFDFVRLKDTLSVSFLLDTTYHPIGYSVLLCSESGYKGFSNDIDTIVILSYDFPNIEKDVMDTSKIRKNIMKSMKTVNRQVKNLTIEKNGSFMKSKFYEFFINDQYMKCGILDTLQKISLLLQLETSKIDPENELTFNTACNSLRYKIRKKN